MPRVKRGTIGAKTRRNVLSRAKGYRFGRSSKEKQAREALLHAGAHAYKHRRTKKRDMRALWNIKIGAGARKDGVSYSRLMGALKAKDIQLNRKVLAELAEHEPETFKRIITQIE